MSAAYDRTARPVNLAPSDSLCTPEHLLAPVRAMGVIALDPCSNPQSTVRALCSLSLERGDDGLQTDWSVAIEMGCIPGLVFMNCPYSRGHLRKWTAKVVEEAARGCEVISLLPTDPTTKWWATINDSCSARCLVRERVGFVGGAHATGTIRSTFFYHGPRRYLFAHHFEALGEISVHTRRIET
jgi:hypothetical protein